MQPHTQATLKPRLEVAIDSSPLTVEPATSLWEALSIMSKAQASCALPGLELSLNWNLRNQARASSIWVVEDRQVLGVLTEADALRWIVSGQDLASIPVSEVMAQPAIALLSSEEQDVFTALALLREHHTQALPVVDAQNSFLGVISIAGIRSALQLDELLKSKPLTSVLLTPILQAPVTTPVLELARLMSDNQSDCVVITAATTEEPTLIGMVFAKDVIQLRILGQDLAHLTAQAIMGTPLLCFPPEQSVLAAYWEMQQQQVQRFVVSEDGKIPLGIVTPTSFLQTLDLNTMQSVEAEVQQSVEQFALTRTAPESAIAPAAVALSPSDSADLLEQLKCSRLLSTMALHIRESLNLDEILQTAVNEVRQFLQTDRVLIYQFNPDMSGTVVVESLAAGWHPALHSTIQDTCFGKNYAHAYKAGRTQVVEDIYAAGLTQCHIDILVLFDIRASLVVPILQGEHLWGLLCAYHCSAPRRWQSFEVDLLKQLAIHVAIAIQQSELYQQAQTELNERKRAEEQLKLSLKEKESLLKEIHHRVKNNLQIISSVLRLQSDYIKDEKILALFNESQHRIRSMALIHEKLYQSKDLSSIHMGDYIDDLTNSLLRSYGAMSHNILLQAEVDNVWLDIDKAIPCGLIINELISNALKHAFPNPTDSEHQNNIIRVDIHQTNAARFQLKISDNGIGLPKEIDFRNTESLGLELVCIFTEQLGGEIELNREQGTSFTITFP
ncbi:CBS domain-containing protein [Oscillatoria sp. FACHB-1407]|uniref:histidine kinase dimerization/phosphoacceptor domain -containing protein n=1 Tax=Oscillatoria sp. FACHB-1407 TaxID=2692847 RepID=UPI0016880032|nr:histidine kinase dimerization/phosphoacceptor domain -containing protein [Oscillatoria sp. FACHB-1407]MBD2461440.1 CBS domain-containing protein [Oscillatoria sp. FACHB-1407]